MSGTIPADSWPLSPPLPHPRTVRTLRATMTQAALRIHLNTHKRRVYRHAYGYKESSPIYVCVYIYIYPICFLYLAFGPYLCRFNKKESETIILDIWVCYLETVSRLQEWHSRLQEGWNPQPQRDDGIRHDHIHFRTMQWHYRWSPHLVKLCVTQGSRLHSRADPRHF